MWCCCAPLPPCLIFSDNFNRADAANPGANWNVVSGDFPIVVNKLSVNDSDALILCNTTADLTGLGEADGYYITVSVATIVDDQEYKVYLNYTDSSNYHYALCIKGASSSLCITFYQVEGGVTTQLGEGANVGATTLNIGITGCLMFVFGVFSRRLDSLALTSGTFGFGTGTLTSTVTFDTFSATYIRNATDPADDCTPAICPANCHAHSLESSGAVPCLMDQESGTWTSFFSTPNVYVETSDSDAILVTKESVDGLYPQNHCAITIQNGVGRAIIGYVDSNNYYYATPVIGDSNLCDKTTGGGVRVYQVVGGTHNLLGEFLGASTSGSFVQIKFCKNWIYASADALVLGVLEAAEIYIPHTIPDLTNTRCGIGSGTGTGLGGASGVSAYAWTTHLYDDSVNGYESTCGDCGDWCDCGDGGVPADTATLTISGFTFPCDSQNGTVELENMFGCLYRYCWPTCAAGSRRDFLQLHLQLDGSFNVVLWTIDFSGNLGSLTIGNTGVISCVDGSISVTDGTYTVTGQFDG